MQVDQRAEGGQFFHNGLAVHRTAAGGDYRAVQVEVQQDFFFNVPQALETFRLKDFFQGRSRPHLDVEVGIDETQAAELGQQYPDAALAGTGHADQADALEFMHKTVSGREWHYPQARPAAPVDALAACVPHG